VFDKVCSQVEAKRLCRIFWIAGLHSSGLGIQLQSEPAIGYYCEIDIRRSKVDTLVWTRRLQRSLRSHKGNADIDLAAHKRRDDNDYFYGETGLLRGPSHSLAS
jgi:hypothetical protein